jgi:predicted nucleic acid-binding protein
MVTAPTAIIDACVLYSAPIRDLVVRIAQAGLIQARWSDEIHEEWMRSLLNNNPRISRARLERTRSLMDGALRDCVVTGHMQIVDSLTLPDPHDRHVLAAAVHAGAELIVTFNLSDFPPQSLAPHGVKARHPDELCFDLLNSAPDEFCAAARSQRLALKNPPMTVAEFLAKLELVGLPRAIKGVRTRFRLSIKGVRTRFRLSVPDPFLDLGS